MQRHDAEYQRRKLAWTLLQTREWSELLLPMLEQAANQEVPEVMTLDAGFQAAKIQGEKKQAKFFVDRLNRLAGEFVKLPIVGSEAPIVVPE